jgi:hypothetical protein
VNNHVKRKFDNNRRLTLFKSVGWERTREVGKTGRPNNTTTMTMATPTTTQPMARPMEATMVDDNKQEQRWKLPMDGTNGNNGRNDQCRTQTLTTKRDDGTTMMITTWRTMRIFR